MEVKLAYFHLTTLQNFINEVQTIMFSCILVSHLVDRENIKKLMDTQRKQRMPSW